VTAVDARSLRVLASIRVGPRPHNLVILGDLVLVATQGSREISVLDASRLREVQRIAVGRTPHDVAGGTDGRRAYV